MARPVLFERFAREPLMAALADTPVVLIHGPRQCGKTTLAQMVGDAAGYHYITFDDDVQFEAATADPIGFVDDLPERAVLDEVQRVPSVFRSLKASVDRDRRPGRFILTGSTNVLLVPQLADSLAGRMEILRLHPLSQDELAGTRSQFLDHLFHGRFQSRRFDRLGRKLADRVVGGGYPAALARATEKRRAAWYRDYIEALIQRDVRDLARLRSLDALPRLLQLAAGQSARLVNVAEMASAFQLSRPTIKDYVVLLERLFLLEHLAPWHSNRLSRLIKTPKLHLCDTGIASALLDATTDLLAADRALFGQLLETFVVQEFKRQASWYHDPVRFFHFRNKDKLEVDLVLESVGAIAGVEIKAGATVTRRDFRGLRKLRDICGDRFAAGVVLYDGSSVAGFGKNMTAIPIRALWETTDTVE